MNEIKSRYRQIKTGLSVVTNKELKNGNFIIPKGTNGKIVYAHNQVDADIWLLDNFNSIDILTVENSPLKSTKFKGIVLNLKGTDFSIKYIYKEHCNMMFNKNKLLEIPYLDFSILEPYEGSFYENNKLVIEYKLMDIINSIEYGFSDFVNGLEQRAVTEDDSTDLDYVFTDDSIELFLVERNKILEPFMKATGIYYNFLGGSFEY